MIRKRNKEMTYREYRAIQNCIDKGLIARKIAQAKKDIITYSKDFYGFADDEVVIAVTGLKENFYYELKAELIKECFN